MRAQVLCASLLAVICAGCGGGGGGYGGSPSTPTPTPSTGGSSNITTVTITGQKGDQSFSPNPAMCATGQMIVWKNADTTTHRIVIPDLGIDTGNIAPGASSQPVSLANVSKAYHCSLHPSMVGAVNSGSTPNDGGGSPY